MIHFEYSITVLFHIHVVFAIMSMLLAKNNSKTVFSSALELMKPSLQWHCVPAHPSATAHSSLQCFLFQPTFLCSSVCMYLVVVPMSLLSVPWDTPCAVADAEWRAGFHVVTGKLQTKLRGLKWRERSRGGLTPLDRLSFGFPPLMWSLNSWKL